MELELALVVVLVITFFACAIIGFVQSLIWLVTAFSNNKEPSVEEPTHSIPTLEGDVEAARRLVNYLYREAQIDDSDRDRIQDFLDRRLLLGDAEKFPALNETTERRATTEVEQSESAASIEWGEVQHDTASPIADDSSENVPNAEVVTAELVPQSQASSGFQNEHQPAVASFSVAAAEEPAPWDLPDPPAPTPRRSFQEVLSGFMEEKNMRWGELASGLLIVLSAVGLVVSLRDQLSDRIPYFSALLFLLITAAIHGAGIYTLKQWRLKNTSRGTLIIGLLLIPINFFAACLLNGDPTDRAEMTDPWYWTAMMFGMISFGVMATWSSILLFKKGVWPIVVGLLGTGAATLWINRVITPDVSTLHGLLATVPVLIAFAIGSLAISKGQWNPNVYFGRSAIRNYTFLAISAFATLSAIALFIARSESAVVGMVTMLPTLTTVGIVVAWIGTLTKPTLSKASQLDLTPVSTGNDSTQLLVDNQTASSTLIGLSLQVLGATIAIACMSASLSNPTVLTASLLVGAVALAAFAFARRSPFLLPVPWLLAVIGFLSALLQWNGKLPFSDWVTASEFWAAVLTAPAALYFLGAAVFTLIATLLAHRSFPSFRFTRQPLVKGLVSQGPESSDNRFLRFGIGSAVAMLLIGSVLAVTASLLHRDQSFELTVASSLLCSLASATCGICWFLSHKTNHARVTLGERDLDNSTKSLFSLIKRFHLGTIAPAANAVILTAALSHLLIWDQRVNSWLTDVISANPENQLGLVPWLLIAATNGILMSLLAWRSLPVVEEPRADSIDLSDESLLSRRAVLSETVLPIASAFSTANYLWAVLFIFPVSLVSLLFLVPAAGGWATALQTIACGGWFLVGVSLIRASAQQRNNLKLLKSQCMIPLLIAFSATAVSGITELALSRDWIEQLFDSRHGLLTAITLAGVAVIFVCGRAISHFYKTTNWLTQTFPMDYVLIGLSLFVSAVLLLDQSTRGIANEILGDREWANDALNGSLASSLQSVPSALPWLTLGAIGIAAVFAWFERPNRWFGQALVLTWFLGWAFASTQFAETKAIATATRWLLPIGGIILAAAMSLRHWLAAPWSKLRASFNQPGRSLLKREQQQSLINSLLVIVTLVVLLISTMTTAQVLLNSPQSLGGPLKASIFKTIPLEANFGMPLTIVVATFLLLAITERRRWLATFGSVVFQFVVLMALYFLITSPHPKIASRWFAGILQTVSIGMTGYGLIWFFFRRRINSQPGATAQLLASRSHLQIHTLVNGGLMTGMASVVLTKVFTAPSVSIGWTNSFGSTFGLTAIVVFMVLAFLVWKKELLANRIPFVWSALVGWAGVVSVGLLIARYDRIFQDEFVAWSTHRIATLGFLFVGMAQIAAIAINRWLAIEAQKKIDTDDASVAKSTLNQRFEIASGDDLSSRFATVGTVAFVGALGILAAIHGLQVTGPTANWFWAYASILGIWTLIAMAVGLYSEQSSLGFVASLIAATGLYWICQANPSGWLPTNAPNWANLSALATAGMATIWSLYLSQRHRRVFQSLPVAGETGSETSYPDLPEGTAALAVQPSSLFSLYPTVSLIGCVVWIGVSAQAEPVLMRSAVSTLTNPIGWTLLAVVTTLFFLSTILNPDARGRVFAWTGTTLAIATALVTYILQQRESLDVEWYVAAWAATVGAWGLVWANRRRFKRLIIRGMANGSAGVSNLATTFANKLPIATVVASAILILVAAFMLVAGRFEQRPGRYALAAVPLWCAFSFACQSNTHWKRWLQLLCLGTLTIGGILISFAEMQPRDITSTKLLVRAFIVLGGSMFVYGSLVSRWVRHGDTWLQSLREMAVVVCGVAVALLIAVVCVEAYYFLPDDGCGLSLAEAMGMAVVMLGMTVGLVTLAIRPENDPFSLSLQGRMGYVYVAQLVMAALVAHLYFSSPWLFQLGLREYWPFIVMALCFIGVGISEVLKKRNLAVLSVPLFNVASVLPVLVAAMSFLDSSQVETELRPASVMMMIGLLYLMVCFLRKTVVSGAACVVFGNAALWLLFHHFPATAFLEHPQLWLIPPAASVLLASQLIQTRLKPEQLTTIRYVSAAVIYIGSTSEIFIRGIGDSLWPPMVLAGFAVLGILAGMLMRVRSFLYFGSLFLLIAMLTMVSHAHQKFEHVWPWWAFGITLGVMILIMFGLFEKRKNEMKHIADQFKKWDG